MKRRIAFVVLIVLVFAVLLVRHSERAPKRHYSDFRVYYDTAQKFLNKEDLYSQADPTITPFKYSPTFALLISPLAFFPIKTASILFFSVSFLSIIGIMLIAEKIIVEGPPLAGRRWVLVALPVLFCFRQILGVLDSGQTTLIMIFLTVLSWQCFSKGKTKTGGALLAISILIKYLPAILLPYFLLKKKFKELFFTLFFLILFFMAPILFVGNKANETNLSHWAPSVSATALDRGSFTDYKNQSLYSLVLRHLMINSPYKSKIFTLELLTANQALVVGGLISAVLFLLMVYPKSRHGPLKTVELALLFTGMALFNPNAWPFNGVFLLFSYMVILYYLLRDNFRNKLVIGFLAASIFLTNCGSEALVGSDWQYFSEVWSFTTWGWVALLCALYGVKRLNR